jgi:hypothetical protein
MAEENASHPVRRCFRCRHQPKISRTGPKGHIRGNGAIAGLDGIFRASGRTCSAGAS